MSVKFKIGFTIDGETLFRMLSKFLPVDDLHVEEFAPPPAAVENQKWVANYMKKFDAPEPKPKNKFKKKRKPSVPMDLTAGINRIILEALAHGMARSSKDIAPALVKSGYSPNSVGSRLTKLEQHGVVESMGDGSWRLTDKYVPSTTKAVQDVHLPQG